MSVLQKVTITSPFGESDECAAFTLTNALETYTLFDVCDVGREYVFSFWLKSAAAGSLAVLGQSIVSSATWTEHVIRYVAQSKNLVLDFNAAGTYYIYHAQNELGNQQTDYSEAPEDAEERLDHTIKITAEGLWETIRSVQSDLTGTTERVTKVEKTAEGITESVTAIEKDQEGLETRVKSAEEQIKPDRIVQTVLSSDGYAEERKSIIDQTDNQITMAVQDKASEQYVADSIGAIKTFNGSTVKIENSGVAITSGGTFSVETGAGVTIKSGGTFVVDSAKFEIDGKGKLSAGDAIISGQLSVGDNDVWHKGTLVVSTAAPSNPTSGTLWVKPDLTAIPAAGTWSHEIHSRPTPWVKYYDYALSGTNIGAAPSNATYTYEVSVPVYYKYGGSGSCTVDVYLSTSSTFPSGSTVSMGTKTFNDSNEGGSMYTATQTSGIWIGNTGTIYMRVEFGTPSLMCVNSNTPFTCTLTAKSQGANGWKICEVQMYMG